MEAESLRQPIAEQGKEPTKPLTQKQRMKIMSELEEDLFWADRVHVTSYHKGHGIARHHWHKKTLEDPTDIAAKAFFLVERGVSKGHALGANTQTAYDNLWYMVMDSTYWSPDKKKTVLFEEKLINRIQKKIDEAAPRGTNRRHSVGNRRRQFQKRTIYHEFLHDLDLNGERTER